MSFRDNVVAWLRRQGDGGLYTEDHFRLGRRTDIVVASFLGFIAWLAATR